jgi:hypothetical protein
MDAALVAQQTPEPPYRALPGKTYRISLLTILAIVVYVILTYKKRKRLRRMVKGRRRKKSS